MIELILENPKIAAWVFNTLITFFGILISLLLGFAIFYFKETMVKVRRYDERLSQANYRNLEFKESTQNNFQSLHASNKDLWEELARIQRTVASGVKVLRGRKAEINRLLDEQRRSKNKMDAYDKLHRSQINLLRRSRGELDLIKTQIICLKDDISIIKTKGKGNGT